MNSRYHAIPRDQFDALAAGDGGPDAIGTLAAAEYSKHVHLLHGVATAASAAGALQARYARVGLEILTEVERLDRDAALRVSSYPAVGAWAICAWRELRAKSVSPAANPARLAAVAAAAVVRSGVDAEIPVLPVAGVVWLPSLGAALVDSDSAVVCSKSGRAEIRWEHGRVVIPADPRRDVPGWLGIRDCRARNLAAVIDDLDPFRMPAVPDLAARLTDAEARYWRRDLRRGWEVLARAHPVAAAEVAATVSAIVPLRRSAHGHVSSSSPETFGAVAMSLPPDADTCASTLAHEVQHVKLSAVLDIVRLTTPDDGRRYYAPWRDDPRPVAGLLQGAYAHLGVTEFWRRRRQSAAGAARSRAEREFALWRLGTVRVIDTLQSSGQLTVTGADFVARMAQTASSWLTEPVPAQARAAAGRVARRHMARWELRHGPVSRPA